MTSEDYIQNQYKQMDIEEAVNRLQAEIRFMVNNFVSLTNQYIYANMQDIAKEHKGEGLKGPEDLLRWQLDDCPHQNFAGRSGQIGQHRPVTPQWHPAAIDQHCCFAVCQ